jgi:hypothetical protein
VCGSSARTDLCGGRSAMIVPTATARDPKANAILKCSVEMRINGLLRVDNVPVYPSAL